MNFLQKVLLYQGWKVRYWTAWTTTQTTLASSWGLLVNIDNAIGDIASTTTNTWLENNTALWFRNIITAWASNEADTAVTRTWTKTLKLSTTNATGLSQVVLLPDWLISPITGTIENWFVVKPSTKYKLSCWVKTNNVAASSTYIRFSRERNASWTIVWSNTDSVKLSWNNDWTYTTIEKTTAATAVYSTIFLVWAWVTWNTWDAWFDINSMTLEEVVEPVANSLTSSSPSLVSFTAVGSTDNIDQSLDTWLAYANTYSLTTAVNEWATHKQTFVPTKSKLTRIGVWVVAKGTGNWTLVVHDASNVVQATATIANASLTNWAFNYFNVPCNVTAWASYHFHVYSTVADGTAKVNTANDLETCSYIENYYKPTTNFKASQNNQTVSISADEDGFLNGSVINLVTWTATFTETFGTFYLLQYTISGSDLIAEINLPWNTLSASFTSDRTLEYSSDWIAYSSTFPTGVTKVWVKILAYSWFASFSYSIQFSTSGINVLRNYPTNKDVISQYSTTLGSATTSATYRATKWGFPAIEYSATEYQFLNIDTTATWSTVAFSETWTSYTTVADGASLAITSTSTPSIFVKHNITANRLFISSNDYSASSDKDWSLRQSVVYQVIQ